MCKCMQHISPTRVISLSVPRHPLHRRGSGRRGSLPTGLPGHFALSLAALLSTATLVPAAVHPLHLTRHEQGHLLCCRLTTHPAADGLVALAAAGLTALVKDVLAVPLSCRRQGVRVGEGEGEGKR